MRTSKSTKVARHRSPGASSDDQSEDGASWAVGFGILGPLADCMDLGPVDDVGPKDRHMDDFGAVSLKRGRSPPVSPASLRGVSPSTVVSPRVSESVEVRFPIPCMAGDLGGKGKAPSTCFVSVVGVNGPPPAVLSPISSLVGAEGGGRPSGKEVILEDLPLLMGGGTGQGEGADGVVRSEAERAGHRVSRSGGSSISAGNEQSGEDISGHPAISTNQPGDAGADSRVSMAHEEVVGKLKGALFSMEVSGSAVDDDGDSPAAIEKEKGFSSKN